VSPCFLTHGVFVNGITEKVKGGFIDIWRIGRLYTREELINFGRLQ